MTVLSLRITETIGRILCRFQAISAYPHMPLYNLYAASTKLHMRVLSTTSNLQTLPLLSATGESRSYVEP